MVFADFLIGYMPRIVVGCSASEAHCQSLSPCDDYLGVVLLGRIPPFYDFPFSANGYVDVTPQLPSCRFSPRRKSSILPLSLVQVDIDYCCCARSLLAQHLRVLSFSFFFPFSVHLFEIGGFLTKTERNGFKEF